MAQVGIIGAGPAGLVAAKSLAEHGQTSVLLERNSNIGGLWNPKASPMWEGMRTNLSEATCSFSDYRHTSPDAFPSADAMYHYLQSYAQTKLDSSTDLRLNTEVTAVTRSDKGWNVSFSDKQSVIREEFFEKLIIASGYFSVGAYPAIQGMDDFTGQIVHAQDYRSKERFRGKNVVVVGSSLSAIEIAADLSSAARHVTHIGHTQTWILPRWLYQQELALPVPLDLVMNRRPRKDGDRVTDPAELRRMRNRYVSQYSRQNELLIPEIFIDPESDEFFPIAISDSYLDGVRKEIIKPLLASIQRFDGSKFCTSAQDINHVDAVIFCTGYQFELPYLDERTKKMLSYDQTDSLQSTILFNAMMTKEDLSLALIGAYKGPFFGIMELQARLAAKVFADAKPPVSDEVYNKELEGEQKIRTQSPRPQFPHGDYVAFADKLALLCGCMPELSCEDPLFEAVNNGPVVPAQYRLQGPHSGRAYAEETLSQMYQRYFKKQL